jgi:hypothetical protein
LQKGKGFFNRFTFAHVEYRSWSFSDIFENRHMGKEIKLLEDHADFQPYTSDRLQIMTGKSFTVQRMQFYASDHKLTTLKILQPVDTPKQCTLSAS